MNLHHTNAVDELLRQSAAKPLQLPDVEECWTEFESLWNEKGEMPPPNPAQSMGLAIRRFTGRLINVFAVSIAALVLTGADQRAVAPAAAVSIHKAPLSSAIDLLSATPLSATPTAPLLSGATGHAEAGAGISLNNDSHSKNSQKTNHQTTTATSTNRYTAEPDGAAQVPLHRASGQEQQEQTFAKPLVFEISALPTAPQWLESPAAPLPAALPQPAVHLAPSSQRIRWAVCIGAELPPFDTKFARWRINLGVSGRALLQRNGWFVQGEAWRIQFQSPKITFVNTTHEDLDGERITKVSVVRPEHFRGIAIGGMLGKNWRTGTSAYAGIQNTLLLHAYVYRESTLYSEITMPPRAFTFTSTEGREQLPDEIRLFDSAIKLGLEQNLGRHWLAGFSLVQGVTDLTKSPKWNTHSDWLLYCGYRF